MAEDAPERGGLLDESWVFWVVVAAATSLGALLRLHGLGRPSFWVDEFFTIGRTGTDPLHWAQALGYLPTWFTLWLKGVDLSQISLANIAAWQGLGITERAARLGPCWVGIASVPILALLTRPVAGAGVAAMSALLIAITPWHLYWSQMARFYSTQFLLVGAFVLLFARALQTGRTAAFAIAAFCGLLALLAHPTSIFIIGACLAAVGLGWITRAPVPHLARAARWLALLVAVFALIAISRQFELLVHGDPNAPTAVAGPIESPGTSTWIADKTRQSWGPPIRGLVVSTVQRVEPITFVIGLIWALVVIRRRDPFGVLASAIALGVPAGVILLAVLFPIGPRYYFPSYLAWTLLAGMWAVEVDRRLAPSAGRLAGISGALALTVAVGFSAFLYARDGAGARLRWREAFAVVQREAGPDDRVLRSGEGDFQAQYYLHRKLPALEQNADVAALAPGTWLIERARGSQPPIHAGLLEVKARYPIPSKPWSWVLYVLRVPVSESGHPN
jgi:hypothetical protein